MGGRRTAPRWLMSSTSKWPAEINLGFAEEVYYDHLRNPASVSDEWRAYFDSMAADPSVQPPAPTAGGPASSTDPLAGADSVSNGQRESASEAALQHCVDKIVRAYRVRGHTDAQIDPLGMRGQQSSPELDAASYGLLPEDLDRQISPETLSGCSLSTPPRSSSACARRMPARPVCGSCTKVEDQPCQSS